MNEFSITFETESNGHTNAIVTSLTKRESFKIKLNLYEKDVTDGIGVAGTLHSLRKVLSGLFYSDPETGERNEYKDITPFPFLSGESYRPDFIFSEEFFNNDSPPLLHGKEYDGRLTLSNGKSEVVLYCEDVSSFLEPEYYGEGEDEISSVFESYRDSLFPALFEYGTKNIVLIQGE